MLIASLLLEGLTLPLLGLILLLEYALLVAITQQLADCRRLRGELDSVLAELKSSQTASGQQPNGVVPPADHVVTPFESFDFRPEATFAAPSEPK